LTSAALAKASARPCARWKAPGRARPRPRRRACKKTPGRARLRPRRRACKKAPGRARLRPRRRACKKAPGRARLRPRRRACKKAPGRARLRPRRRACKKTPGRARLRPRHRTLGEYMPPSREGRALLGHCARRNACVKPFPSHRNYDFSYQAFLKCPLLTLIQIVECLASYFCNNRISFFAFFTALSSGISLFNNDF